VARILTNAPRTVQRGQVFEIRTLIQHPMETGYRPGASGEVLARDIIGHFACSYNGEEVVAAELFPAVAANPFLSFTAVAAESGTLTFTWTGDNGFSQTEVRPISVE
jgi:sulfur-oxidizing protein SoxZ